MDLVEQLFTAFPDPGEDRALGGQIGGHETLSAIRILSIHLPSQDPDHQYLLKHARAALLLPSHASPVGYFRQQVAQLALKKKMPLEGDSAKARQLTYYRWVAQGRKDESYPFADITTPAYQGQSSPKSQDSAYAFLPAELVGISDSTACAACGNLGAKWICRRCHVCLEGHTITVTAYCNRNCQAVDQARHQPICDGRKMIHRASFILKEIFVLMEKATYIYPLIQVIQKDGIIYTFDESWDRSAFTGRPMFWTFPSHLTPSEELLRAVLLNGECDEVNITLRPLVNIFIMPLCKSLEQISFVPKNVHRPICQIGKGKATNCAMILHKVIRVTLHSDEQFVIDLTGQQFGWREVFAPWQPWASRRIAGNLQRHDYGEIDRGLAYLIAKDNVISNTQGLRQIAVGGLARRLRLLNLPLLKVKTMSEALGLPEDRFGGAQAAILKLSKGALDLLALEVSQRNSTRLHFDADLAIRAAGGHGDKLKEAWLSKEEYEKHKGDKNRLLAIWRERRARSLSRA
ncbi:hypothetical protein F5X99DRAFT_423703 [Biscogniauxia marginata]|nr:hypothetical protein F5X99DRAFT_423703 [Biscogniauxia marginata]